jgi:preprotein translocase subunit YajC
MKLVAVILVILLIIQVIFVMSVIRNQDAENKAIAQAKVNGTNATTGTNGTEIPQWNET